ncbi:nucleoporin Nup37 [Pelobates cultripes]|uniref:Nucleoporin Nup37 n=1 Tax=Pelobates cultripes TaxID=61616 RepID=A0AAD1RSQ9_PELCU|nr:nucleoporin Nup37 [Pelobates cultripes]
MKQDSVRSASYTVDCADYIHVVEFNPFESGEEGSLIAFGGNNYVSIASCRFQEDDASVSGIEFKTLKTFNQGIRADAIAWSPDTNYDSLTPLLRFCTAASDKNLRIFTSDLQDKNEFKVFDGHTSYINDVVFCSHDGNTFASVSDDHTCRMWNIGKGQTAMFMLRSPGMSVAWHPEESSKLMVAEKTGTIRFYDLLTHQAILSLESVQVPLMSADWCLKNPFRVGAVAGNDWIIWEMPRSSYPQNNKPVHADRARLFRWSRCSENLFATTGYPGKKNTQLLIHHLKHPQPILIGSVPVGSGLSWHRSLPLCVVGGNHKLYFWFTEM